MSRNREIEREQIVHGNRWGTFHDGYFSNADIARPLLEQVIRCAGLSGAATVVDLGGGTGTLSRLLTEQFAPLPFRLVTMDGSAEQLKTAQAAGVTTHQGSIETFRRADLNPDGGPLLYMMRSVLHYLGREALSGALEHIRRQTGPDEYFVHQTACFSSQEEADCLNELYARMRTEKWYPAETRLTELLQQTGWSVEAILPAPALALTAEDLSLRYALSAQDRLEIRDRICAAHPACGHLFQPDATGFTAYLPYRIFICRNRAASR